MSTSEIQVLNPLSFPLYGARLIEASAGTGKTFTICSLYLRLLLGHGTHDSKHEQHLTVDQILVVTFTEAATEELRARIRTRIKEARYAFLRGRSSDFFIKQLMDETDDHQLAASLLLNAERQMDEAAVYTIHGFCQRMLSNSAFESGALFETSFLVDENKLRLQVVSDYWRTRFHGVSSSLAREIRQAWASPNHLLNEINSYLSGQSVLIRGGEMNDNLEECHNKNLSKITALKEAWQSLSTKAMNSFVGTDINKRSYTQSALTRWVDEVNDWANSPTTNYFTPKSLERFCATELRSKSLRKDKTEGIAPTHELFDKISDYLKQPANIIGSITKDAINNCRELLKQAKEKIYVLSFDDLLTNLNDALKSEHGKTLASRIRELYPIAMIDEFQDTDPLQYNIFSTIYKTKVLQRTNSTANGIFMIGDPKQAIYAFRGADIFTYIKARREVAAHYTLNTNWRSTSGMIDAVNSLFTHSPNPFIFNDDIKFYEALAPEHATQNYWEIDGVKQHPMQLWVKQNPEIISKGDYVSQMAEATVEQIRILLGNPSVKISKNGKSRRAKAGDIAILVRTGDEAHAVKKRLSSQNIPSVYLSNRESVFSTREAQDILRIMIAMSDPYNERAIKPALATHILGLDAESLVALEHDEHLLESVVLEFADYAKIWDRRGIMPALKQLLIRRQVANRLLSNVDGERKIADYQHIAELLQQESQKITSKHGLIRWLTEKIEEPDGNSEDQQMRLESENDLVKIITIHKSKGLEYNFVFLPFLARHRESSSSKYHDDTSSKNILDINKSEYAKLRADNERLAEDLRLLYVAVTRAVYGCFIGLDAIKDGTKKTGNSGIHKSAIGFIIQKENPAPAEDLASYAQILANNCANISINTPPILGSATYEPEDSGTPEPVRASTNKRQINENWYVTSFTALSANAHSHKHIEIDFSFTVDEAQDDEVPELNIFNFPRGAKAGTFLHTIFENINYNEPDSDANIKKIGELMMLEEYEEHWQPVIHKLAKDVLTKPLGDEGFCLSQIPPEKLLCEMEFTFPISKLQPSRLASICRKHDPVSEGMELNFLEVSGMLKGFIDLTFEHNGKFYVLDWKSNHLGNDQSLYTEDALVGAMQDHRYDLQYQLYCVALHKFLRSRIKDYSYDKHFGGALYIFLRGINEHNNNGIFYSKPSEQFLNELSNELGGNDA